MVVTLAIAGAASSQMESQQSCGVQRPSHKAELRNILGRCVTGSQPWKTVPIPSTCEHQAHTAHARVTPGSGRTSSLPDAFAWQMMTPALSERRARRERGRQGVHQTAWMGHRDQG